MRVSIRSALAAGFACTIALGACAADSTVLDPSTPAGDAAVDVTLDRDDVDCSEDGLGSDDEVAFVVAHFVVDGALGERCFGEADPSLLAAWNDLATITPPGQLADLGLFGGFVSTESGDEVTLAFVTPLDLDGSLFQMAVNLDDYDANGDEAKLTMAHEFSHVFTALPSQIDRSAESADNCTTYDNTEGCYLPDSIMAQWIDLFWGDLIDEIDPEDEPLAADGEDRCASEPGFFGPYAASSPEEDFAESFAVFVFRVEPDTPEQRAKLDWIAEQPGLAEFRERAVAAGLGPLANPFEMCGAG